MFGIRLGASLAALSLIALSAAYLIARALDPGADITGVSIDLRAYYFPLYRITYAALAAGELPLWNPHHLGGVPTLATLQVGFFYPSHLLYLWLPTHTALALSQFLHIAWIAVSTLAFGRKAGLATSAAALAGIAFALCGTVQWWLFWPNMLEAISWLPLGCIGVLGLARGEGARAVCILVVATAMSLLAGGTQASVFLVCAWATLWVALNLASGRSGRSLAVSAASAVGALALGVVLSAAQTLPTFELTLEGTRTLASLKGEVAGSVGLYGYHAPVDVIWGSRFSLGLVALAFAPCAFFERAHRRIAWWALALGASAAALGLGSGTALMDVYLALPGIGWFRQPHRLLLLTQFSVAVLGGLGFDALLRERAGAAAETNEVNGRASRRAAWFRAGVVASTALVMSVVFAAREDAVPAAIAAATALAAMTLAIPGAAAAPLARVAPAAVIVIAALGAFAGAGQRERMPYDADYVRDVFHENTGYFHRLADDTDGQRVAWILARPKPELKLAPEYGVRWLDDLEPLTLRRQSEYFLYFQNGTIEPPPEGLFWGGIIPSRKWGAPKLIPWVEGMAKRRRLLDLANVGYFAFWRNELPRKLAGVDAFVEGARLQRNPHHPDLRVGLFVNPHVLPRSFVTYRTTPAPPPAELLRRLSEPTFDPLRESYVEGDPGLSSTPGAPGRGRPAAITLDEPTQVEIDAVLDAPGFVVLADAHYPGWQATVDGEPTPIVATNHLFRGVRAPAGRHRIRFEYSSASLWIGACVSAVGLAVLLLIALRGTTARHAA